MVQHIEALSESFLTRAGMEMLFLFSVLTVFQDCSNYHTWHMMNTLLRTIKLKQAMESKGKEYYYSTHNYATIVIEFRHISISAQW